MTDKRLDETISEWLEAEAPRQLPDRVLRATFERTRKSRQHGGWRALLKRLHINRVVPALGGAAVVVVAAALAMNWYVNRPDVGRLPDTPDSWSQVLIEAGPEADGVISLAASPHGLLAVVSAEGDGPAQLFASTDGRTWTLVPADQHPLLEAGGDGGHGYIVGTDRGFLIVGVGVWASEDGYDWHVLADPSVDPDLLEGTMLAAAVGGPGYVAVGSDKAWYSTDGSDWTLADVPPAPTEFFASHGFPAPTVDMRGVAVAGDKLVAWGIALSDTADAGLTVPVMWASGDGRTWANVLDPRDGELLEVGARPGGFVAVDDSNDGSAGENEVVVRVSADGYAWERVDVLGPVWRDVDETPVGLGVSSIAASNAGFVAVGGLDPVCGLGSCQEGDVVIWTSADGRSWSRLADEERFARAAAFDVVAWRSHFVAGGRRDGQPVIWISDSRPSQGGAGAQPTPVDAQPTPAEETPSPEPTDVPPVEFAGTWEATDPPPDSSHQTMAVIAQPDGSYELTIRDDFASVCGGASSTMTGVAEVSELGPLIIEQPDYTCDDGSQAQALSGPPLEEQLRNLSFTYDFQRDALQDSFLLIWNRVEVAP